MELFIVSICILLGLIWVLWVVFRRVEEDAYNSLTQEREWHNHSDGVHECRYFMFLSKESEWQKEWEIRKKNE